MDAYFYDPQLYAQCITNRAKIAMSAENASELSKGAFTKLQCTYLYDAFKQVADFDVMINSKSDGAVVFVDIDTNVMDSPTYCIPLVSRLSKLVETFNATGCNADYDLVFDKYNHIRTVGVVSSLK